MPCCGLFFKSESVSTYQLEDWIKSCKLDPIRDHIVRLVTTVDELKNDVTEAHVQGMGLAIVTEGKFRRCLKDLGNKQVSAHSAPSALRRSERFQTLPEPCQCPREGVVYSGKLPEKEIPNRWIFLYNQLAKLEIFDSVLGNFGSEWNKPSTSYPVRMHASAGFKRSWTLRGGPDAPFYGDQTLPTLEFVDSAQAHSIVGVVVPFRGSRWTESETSEFGLNRAITMVDAKLFDWLGWMERPADFDQVTVMTLFFGPKMGKQHGPPTYELPMLQSNIDATMEAALEFGEAFAAEWLDSMKGWGSYWINDREQSQRPWVRTPKALTIDRLLRHFPTENNMVKYRKHEGLYVDPPSERQTEESHNIAVTEADYLAKVLKVEHPPPAVRAVKKNYLIGFGSIMQTASRRASSPEAAVAAPCRIKAQFGYVREWNFQASTAQICALGLRRCQPNEKGSSINGVLFPAPDDLTEFDKRENGYQRVVVPRDMIELLSWQELPSRANIFVYVPYSPSVVAKYGMDATTGYPKCMGPNPPEGLNLETEAAGLGLFPPSIKYPILQTYIDVCISGCLEYGEDFAVEFINSTFLWSPFWVNERLLARRPWVHQNQYVLIDKILSASIPTYYAQRKLQSEYAVLFTMAPSDEYEAEPDSLEIEDLTHLETAVSKYQTTLGKFLHMRETIHY
ncbi:hypothetical protein CYMTET_40866 [Cymbomonas tetramitiformis]|uniref:Uncharacterized protein n=1 Tax=Cymbomonas tetramitiformis TaxID=36881 RepID=A0AAE0C760_9CHLO|nr:hypothetical protein CYMTET_40866 [Cymbomonas tetramitiformis]|eukprot:gene18400-21948_t